MSLLTEGWELRLSPSERASQLASLVGLGRAPVADGVEVVARIQVDGAGLVVDRLTTRPNRVESLIFEKKRNEIVVRY